MVSELMTSAVIGEGRADSPGKQKVVSELMTSAVIGEGRADSPGKQVVSELMTSAVIRAVGLTHQESRRWSVN